MVVLVRDNEPVHAVQTHAGRSVELTLPGALHPELAVVAPVSVEAADPVVAPVRHHDEPGFCAANAPGTTQVPVSTALLAELQDRDAYVVVVAARLDHAPEGAVLDVSAVQGDGQVMLALGVWPPPDHKPPRGRRVRDLLPPDVSVVRALDHDVEAVPLQGQLSHVVLDEDTELGLTPQHPLDQSIALSHGEGSEAAGGDGPGASQARDQALLRGVEHDGGVLARLQVAGHNLRGSDGLHGRLVRVDDLHLVVAEFTSLQMLTEALQHEHGLADLFLLLG